MAVRSAQPLTEMSTRDLPGGKGWPARVRLPNSPPSLSGISIKCGNLDVLQPYGPPQPVIGIAFSLKLFALARYNISIFLIRL
jgi:hypothetical protein